ncbi:MAG: hypothetical protein ACR2MG_14210, partial [Pyrinomonadaceae bacterium]
FSDGLREIAHPAILALAIMLVAVGDKNTNLQMLWTCVDTNGSLQGTVPAGLAAGSPAGSYSISGIENVNLYNGRLSVNVPLLQIGGRGEAGYTISAPINNGSWTTEVGGYNYS